MDNKCRSKVKKQIMAVVLSAAMVLSNLTVFASESGPSVTGEPVMEEVAGEDSSNSGGYDSPVDDGEKAEKESSTETGSRTEEESSGTEAESADGESAVEETEEKSSELETESTEKETSAEEETSTEEETSSEKETVEKVTESETESAEEETSTVREPEKEEKDDAEYDSSKIDVWDFGAEQLDTDIYNNMLTVDIINSWYPEVAAGTLGETIASFTEGDLSFDSGGKAQRLRTTNKALTRYDERSLKSTEGVTYTGYIYSNSSSSPDVYLTLKAQAGDIITLVASSNGKTSDIVFHCNDDENVKDQVCTFDLGNSSTAGIYTYYAVKDGTYKIYSATEKLVVARIYREHAKQVTVSGNVTAPAGATGLTLVFTCVETGAKTEASVTDGKYEAKLYAGYTYEVSVENNGYVIKGDSILQELNGDTTKEIEIIAVSTVKLSGSIGGLDDAALDALKISFALPEGDTEHTYVPEVTLNRENKTYEALLESGVEYTIKTEGINDYQLDATVTDNSETVQITTETTRDITYARKPVYTVTLEPEGVTIEKLKELGAKVVFTNTEEEGYEYVFGGDDNTNTIDAIKLRDGTYSVAVSKSGVYVQQLTSNLTVDGKDVSKPISFKAYVTEWNFGDKSFTKERCDEGWYNGLELTGVQCQDGKSHAVLKADSVIKIPVEKECEITVSYYYQANATIGESTNFSIEYAADEKPSTSKKGEVTYSSSGKENYVELKASGETYLTRIEISFNTPYKEKITVGAKDCDYTTINDALAAVRSMDRKEDQKVTIEIQPGNYEEMLVIDVDNVALVNAKGDAASIGLKNKGVDIDDNAVRITSYYGHGYSYYSMGSDCKWNEEILKVNKANGKLSFDNPGSGTTSGSYWNATVVISGSNVEAKGIIFENSFNQYVSQKAADDIIVKGSGAKEPADAPRAGLKAGDTAVQDKAYVERAAALAITNDCKQVFFDNCKFVGRQDTLYGGKGVTAGFYDCSVYGGTDYIFGGMTAVFAKCDLVFNTSEDKNDVGYITAAQQTSGRGYLMYNCHVTSTEPGVDTASEYTSKAGYFGRPWAANTGEAVFYKTIIDATETKWYRDSPSMIKPEGWLDSLSGKSALSAEYSTYERAVDVDNQGARAEWATVLTEEKLSDGSPVTIGTFLGDWNPFSGKDMAIRGEAEFPKEDHKPDMTGYEAYTFDVTKDVDVTGLKDNTALAAGTKYGTKDYFKVLGTVKPRIKEEKITSFEIDKAGLGALRFRITGTTANVVITVSSTGGSNESAVALVGADGTVINNNENITVVKGTEKTEITYTDLGPGVYRLISPLDATRNRGVRMYTIEVQEKDGNPGMRSEWSSVAAPVIEKVALNEKDPSKVDVTVKAEVGDDGADLLTVQFKDKDGKVAASNTSADEKDTHIVSVEPGATGEYAIVAAISRSEEGAEPKSAELTEKFAFTLPLAAPVITSATSTGKVSGSDSGSVRVKWDEVKEADGYIVTVEGTEISKDIAGGKTLSAVIDTGLEIGKEYTFHVTAKRGEERSSLSEGKKVLITEDQQVEWAFSAYGSSTSAKKDGYEFELNNDKKVRVYSVDNGGKLVPNSTDGLAFYYTAVPNDLNFTLTATAHINNWTFSNGQEGFGLMAADRVGTNGDSSAFWNNSYLAMVSKVEYFWDEGSEQVSDAGKKVSMKLGVGALERKGVTPAGLEELDKGATIPAGFTTKTDTLETSCANKDGSVFNLAGNAKNEVEGTIEKPYVDFTFTVRRNNTGYFISYEDPATGRTITNKYYDTAALSKLDTDNVYVGFFASRNADITFDNVTFKTVSPADDDPAEERPVTYVTPSYQVLSASVANSEDYTLVFNSNWDGQLVVRDSLNKELYNGKVYGSLNEEQVTTDGVTKDKYEKIKISGIKLHFGINKFTLTFTPDADWAPKEFTKLTEYDTKTFSHTVTYRKYGNEGEALYVSPDGLPSGVGTREQPLDIYTAVKYVQPGQTIILLGGTYKLINTVKTERGISGTADKPIRMIADPETSRASGTQPIFDFGGYCAGMVLAGDYWYFKGFDVIRSANGQKGIQVSGNYNTLDQINTYKNGNTGIQIARYQGTDAAQAEWPSYNTILNCTSYLNADSGYEDADGFAAKLTIGPGNVFDGCISHHNADDGWDLFAKAETGPIGQVVIQNCVAYKNGYVLKNSAGELDINGEEVLAGNGNGFKMGGESITGYHTLKNSISFFNKAKGIDSNSCPDIQVYNSITFNNGSYNVAFYTNNAKQTDFLANGVISYRTLDFELLQKDKDGNPVMVNPKDQEEQLKLVGDQAGQASEKYAKVYNDKSWYWNAAAHQSLNTAGQAVADDWFTSLSYNGGDMKTDGTNATISRNANGTVNTNGFLMLSDKAGLNPSDVNIGGEPSKDPSTETDIKDPSGSVEKGDDDDDDDTVVLPGDIPEDGIPTGLWIAIDEEDDIYYTGQAVEPEIRVYMGSTMRLEQGKHYGISYKNNTKASVAMDENGKYTKQLVEDEAKMPVVTITGKGSYEGAVSKTFAIKAVDLASERVCASDVVVVTDGTKDQKDKAKPTVLFNGKKLTAKDFTITYTGDDYKSFGRWPVTLTGTGNFTGATQADVIIVDKNDPNTVLMSQAKVTGLVNQVYDGQSHVPQFKVTAKGQPLTQDKEYEIKLYNNTEIGTAVIAIMGKGEVDGKNYVGTKTVTFKITGGRLNERDFTITGVPTSPVTYSGAAETPVIQVKQNSSGKNLVPGRDYTVTYRNNRKAGNASVAIKGVKNYSGTVTKSFRIEAYDIEKDVNGWVGGSSKIENLGYSYTMGGVKPNMTLVINGKNQIPGTDYTVTYKNNNAVAPASGDKAPTAVIKGKNGLKGTINVQFEITPSPIDNPESGISFVLDDSAFKANQKGSYYEKKVTVNQTVTDAKGKPSVKKLAASSYKLTYYLKPAKETALVEDDAHNLHTMTKETLAGMLNLSEDKAQYNGGDTVVVKIDADNATAAKKLFTGTVYQEYRIVKYDIKKARIAAIAPKYYGGTMTLTRTDFNTFEYDADTQAEVLSESKVTYKDGANTHKLLYSTNGVDGDFVVDTKTYVNANKVGTVKVTIRGLGDYGGSKVISYKVKKMSWNIAKAVIEKDSISAKRADGGLTETKLGADDLKDKVFLNGKALTYGTDFVILGNTYKYNERKSTATVTIRGIRSYGGTKKITFRIVEG